MRQNKKSNTKFNLSNLWVISFIVFVLGSFVYEFTKRHTKDYYLQDFDLTKAIIINEKNYYGNSPVSHEFSFSYSFSTNGKTFIGNSQNSKYKVGDTVLVEVSKSNPKYNRIHN